MIIINYCFINMVSVESSIWQGSKKVSISFRRKSLEKTLLGLVFLLLRLLRVFYPSHDDQTTQEKGKGR